MTDKQPTVDQMPPELRTLLTNTTAFAMGMAVSIATVTMLKLLMRGIDKLHDTPDESLRIEVDKLWNKIHKSAESNKGQP